MLDLQTPWDPSNRFFFTDRDGVVNILITGDYIKSWEEFHFIPGTLEALVKLRPLFKRMLVVTNQRGIAKKLMTDADLHDIHTHMQAAVDEAGGHFDGVYYCPNHPEDDPEGCRKPRIGMARQAQTDFPEIDFDQSIMLGDNISDMEFGRNAGMFTVFICADGPPAAHTALVDHHCPSLADFADWLLERIEWVD